MQRRIFSSNCIIPSSSTLRRRNIRCASSSIATQFPSRSFSHATWFSLFDLSISTAIFLSSVEGTMMSFDGQIRMHGTSVTHREREKRTSANCMGHIRWPWNRRTNVYHSIMIMRLTSNVCKLVCRIVSVHPLTCGKNVLRSCSLLELQFVKTKFIRPQVIRRTTDAAVSVYARVHALPQHKKPREKGPKEKQSKRRRSKLNDASK